MIKHVFCVTLTSFPFPSLFSFAVLPFTSVVSASHWSSCNAFPTHPSVLCLYLNLHLFPVHALPCSVPFHSLFSFSCLLPYLLSRVFPLIFHSLILLYHFFHLYYHDSLPPFCVIFPTSLSLSFPSLSWLWLLNPPNPMSSPFPAFFHFMFHFIFHLTFPISTYKNKWIDHNIWPARSGFKSWSQQVSKGPQA